jgi:hypothetical protein
MSATREAKIQTATAGLLSLPLLSGAILTVGELSRYLFTAGSLSFSFAVAGWFLIVFQKVQK